MKSLLIETNLFEGKVKEDEGGRTLVKGILQRASAENQNGRVYPKEILMREAKKYEVLIKERRALGELDHPDSTVINLKNVSHNVREIHWEGDDLCGTVEILPTPSGNKENEKERKRETRSIESSKKLAQEYINGISAKKRILSEKTQKPDLLDENNLLDDSKF